MQIVIMANRINIPIVNVLTYTMAVQESCTRVHV